MTLTRHIPHAQSRRKLPQLEVLGLVDGQLIPLDVPLTVRDLGDGGFSVQSPSPFPPGTRRHFRFTTPSKEEVTVDATAVHCRLAEADVDGHIVYVTGFEFIGGSRTDDAVCWLVDSLSSVFSID